MTRETAVTEEISYSTEQCRICGEEVATASVPADEMSHHGFAVLLGEGNVTHQSENAGNWDEEIHFTLDEEKTGLPAVEGYIICEHCSDSIHDHEETKANFTGEIPPTINPLLNVVGEPGSEIPRDTLIYVIIVILTLLFLLLILL